MSISGKGLSINGEIVITSEISCKADKNCKVLFVSEICVMVIFLPTCHTRKLKQN